jgi:SprB repeat
MKKAFLNRVVIIGACYLTSCVYKELPKGFDCTKSSLTITLLSKQNATSCKSIDGKAIMSAVGGVPPYDFSLGDGIYQTNPEFNRLAPGSYLITVKDINGCKQSVRVDLDADNSNLAATAASTSDSSCDSDNGTINVTISNGTSPYTLKIDNGQFGAATQFSNVGNGNHTVIVKDSQDCERVLIVAVGRGNTGISYKTVIEPIFIANCEFSGCHGTGSTGHDWTKFSDVKSKAADIKIRTANRSMPIGDKILTAVQIQQIACWVDDGANQN